MATRAPVTGSVTMTVDLSPSSSSSSSSSAPAASSAHLPAESVVLQLRRWPKKVTWKEGTVDNESLGRKSSKKCCIFHKEVPFDEDCSDDEPNSSGRQSPPRDGGEGTSGGGSGECCSSSSHGHVHGH
ncbi:hypothetical protein E2562_032750 [Oryza meyeriana var. granulata]|uniref:Type 1 phosphatases regulator n=1 Tax=Oryza meyeriana var. granulata TaxID=110450 RepID=A0A6G1E5J8_9ORYZ|nr:hypothetical protein E2562_032750 [Oryza meyeriana var. granulata]KAF0920059.1 hypothetical protein E2562_032750 [Oryza meyeriana var. granulata]